MRLVVALVHREPLLHQTTTLAQSSAYTRECI